MWLAVLVARAACHRATNPGLALCRSAESTATPMTEMASSSSVLSSSGARVEVENATVLVVGRT